MESERGNEAKYPSKVRRTSSGTSDSQTYSPQRFHSPLRSEFPETPPYSSPSLSATSPMLSPPVRSPEMPSLFRSPEKQPSPRRSLESLSSLESSESPSPIANGKAIVSFEKSTQLSPSPSPSPPHSVKDTEAAAEENSKSPPRNTPRVEKTNSPVNHTAPVPNGPNPPLANFVAAADEEKSPSPMVLFNRSVKEEVPHVTTKKKMGTSSGVGGGSGAVTTILRRTRRQELVKLGALGFRLSEVVLSLISFAVMAADRTQGWSGDSYDRYKEYRYCLSVNVVAFVYSGFQACDLGYYLVKEKHLIHHHLRPIFDFFMDQVLAYLLVSASSAAATRVDDWVSNWGSDDFTVMATASVTMSFLAFVAFAISSLISGYELCTRESIR